MHSNRRNFRVFHEIGVEEQILDRKWKYGRFAHQSINQNLFSEQ